MTLHRARLRTTHEGRLVEIDMIKCESCEWQAICEAEPSLALWRATTFPDGTLVALEPVRDAASRFCALCPANLDLPDDRRVVHIRDRMTPGSN